MYMNPRSQAAQAYQRIGTNAAVMEADPHRLIEMLLAGALERLARARGALAGGDREGRTQALNGAVGILDGLRGALDFEHGGQLAQSLDGLYQYMTVRLFEANRSEDLGPIDEVSGLIREIKSGWDGIRDQAQMGSARAAGGLAYR